MPTQLNPYISFRDNAREALEFYHSVFGGELSLSTFEDFHASDDAAEKDKIMHGALKTPGGLNLMAADTPASMDYTVGDNISISLGGDSESELRGYWEKLVDGGVQVEPLSTAPWGDIFGMCVDKFGIHWMVNIAGTPGVSEQRVEGIDAQI
ncbi:MAG TPA: VOC family protein [Glaciihabitans sp.]|jgi:PhnB protein|nr:VOC family protein [Glaciihabitans sp.]